MNLRPTQRGIADGWLLLIVLATMAVGVVFVAEKIDQRGYDRGRLEVQAKFDAFKADLKDQAAKAEKQKVKQETQDKAAKEKADAYHKRELDRLYAAYISLRDQRSRTRFLSVPATGAANPDRACFERAELERILGRIDERGSAIAFAGDQVRVGLDAAKMWAQGR